MRALHALAAVAAGLCLVVPAQADDLEVLSTVFDAPGALEGWREHAPDGFSPKWAPPTVEDGALALRPTASGWYEDNQAGHLYRAVEGDFIVTTRIAVTGTTADIPQTPFSLAGLFVRAPRAVSAAGWAPGQENWLFLSVGTASPAGAPQYETKTTTNSLSTLKILPARTGPVDLRIARHGELFTLLVRPEGEAWRVLDQMIRPDLPAVLNVGLTAYSDYASVAAVYPDFQTYNTQGPPTDNADLIARVERVEFRRPVTPRLPIANLDAPAALAAQAIAARQADLTAD